jgi:hypothetical protein
MVEIVMITNLKREKARKLDMVDQRSLEETIITIIVDSIMMRR